MLIFPALSRAIQMPGDVLLSCHGPGPGSCCRLYRTQFQWHDSTQIWWSLLYTRHFVLQIGWSHYNGARHMAPFCGACGRVSLLCYFSTSVSK